MIKLALGLGLVLALTGCSPSPRKPPPFITPGHGQEAYSVDLPAGFELVKGPVVVDFRDDQVVFDGTTYVKISIAHSFDFSNRAAGEGFITSGNPQTSRKAGSPAPSEWLWKTDYTFPAEILVELPDGLTAEQTEVARRIAISLRPTSPSGGEPQSSVR